jgi:hypothetical protein
MNMESLVAILLKDDLKEDLGIVRNRKATSPKSKVKDSKMKLYEEE